MLNYIALFPSPCIEIAGLTIIIEVSFLTVLLQSNNSCFRSKILRQQYLYSKQSDVLNQYLIVGFDFIHKIGITLQSTKCAWCNSEILLQMIK